MRALSVIVFTGLVLSAACSQRGALSPPPDRRVSVHGAATIPSRPDRVSFTAGVETRDPSATTAFKANTAKVQTLLSALKARGVTEQEMQTSYLDVGTIPARDKSPRLFKASNLVTITRRDPADVADLIQAAVSAGANDVGSLRFFVGDTSTVQQQGLRQAFADARAKAEVLAHEAGRTLGDVVSMSDQTQYGGDEFRAGLSSLGYTGGRSIETGTEQLHFAVTVVFELR